MYYQSKRFVISLAYHIVEPNYIITHQISRLRNYELSTAAFIRIAPHAWNRVTRSAVGVH